MFCIGIPIFNAADTLAAGLDLLRRQAHREFRCVLVDDGSTDDSAAIARRAIGTDPRFEWVRNAEHRYSLGSICRAIEFLAPGPGEVVVLVDGDDSLYDTFSLMHLANAYADPDCWLTYGSYVTNAAVIPDPACHRYPEPVVARNAFRKAAWHGTHLKSFRAELWNRLDPEQFHATEAEWRGVRGQILRHGRLRRWWQLRHVAWTDMHDPSGRWFRRCSDRAVMFPLLELAGRHAHFIDRPLYRYRTTAASGQGRQRAPRPRQLATRGIREILRARRPLAPLGGLAG